MGEIVMATNFAWAVKQRLYDSGRVDVVCNAYRESGYLSERVISSERPDMNRVIDYVDTHTSGSYSLLLSGCELAIIETRFEVEAVEAMATAMLDGSNRVYDIEEKKYITWGIS